jgi:hypothetical protein
MYCFNCGKNVSSSDSYCVGCGQSLRISPLASAIASATDNASQSPLSIDLSNSANMYSESPDAEKVFDNSDDILSSRGPLSDRVHRPSPTILANPRTTYFVPNPLAILGLGAATLVLVGSFGPWISAEAIFGFHFQKNGTEGDGVLTAICAVVSIVFLTLIVISRRRTAPSWLAAIAFLASTCIGLYDWHDVSARIRALPSDVALHASVGWGLHAVTIGAAIGLILSIVQIAQGNDT